MKISYGVYLGWLLLLSGCGSQDRYQVTDPPIYMEVHEGSFAQINRIPIMHNVGHGYLTAKVNGEIYFSGENGNTYKNTSTGYQALPAISGFKIKDMVTGPGGHLWVTNKYAEMHSFQNGEWVFEIDILIESGSIDGLLYDSHGRLLAYGDNRGLWCREVSGEWNLMAVEDNSTIEAGWSEYGYDPVMVDKYGRLLTEQDGVWSFSEPISNDLYSWNMEIVGNDQGWLLMSAVEDRRFFINFGDSWQEYQYTENLRHMFWLGEDLFALQMYDDALLKWSGTNWEPFLIYDWPWDLTGFNSLAEGTGRRLFYNSGASLFFDGLSLTQKTGPLGQVQSVASLGNTTHLFFSTGVHYQSIGDDGHWDEVGNLSTDDSYFYYFPEMLVDDMGQLVFLKSTGMRIWDGGSSYREISLDEEIFKSFPQADGRILLLLGEGSMGQWANGVFSELPDHEDLYRHVISCQFDDAGQILLATNDHLRVINQERSFISLTLHGWECRTMVWSDEWGQLCGGNGHLLTVNGSTVLNKTPAWHSDAVWHGVSVRQLQPAWLGGWLALDPNRDSLIWFDGEQYWGQGGGDLDEMDYATELRMNLDGSYLLFSYDIVLKVELEGQE